MKPADRPRFAQLLMQIGELYHKPISPTLLALYWQALIGFEWEAIKAALQAHVQNPECGQYLPKPADIIRSLQGTDTEHAQQAWQQVVEAIRGFGSYNSVTFEDLRIHAAITDMGGWVRLCSTTQSELLYYEKTFKKNYIRYLHHPLLHAPKTLSGRLSRYKIATSTQSV